MKPLLATISYASLVWLLTAALLLFTGTLALESVHLHMLLATLIWFAVTPCWMAREA
ncbi:MAG: hypothetical protein H6834_06685 [Planctomycetes bacterium]|nr:hypothetical protein [Planctomycetota bacterium]MCB9891796.1 hypothetical protein [Planctomycetota bacterium]